MEKRPNIPTPESRMSQLKAQVEQAIAAFPRQDRIADFQGLLARFQQEVGYPVPNDYMRLLEHIQRKAAEYEPTSETEKLRQKIDAALGQYPDGEQKQQWVHQLSQPCTMRDLRDVYSPLLEYLHKAT